MGNHLAATASVNVSDISSELELISPLNGNGQNCFATFHCWRHVRSEEQQNEAQRQAFRSISPHVLQMYTQACLEDEQIVSKDNNINSNNINAKMMLQSDDECTNYGELTASNSFADNKKTYAQQLLNFRRKVQQRRLLEINKCAKPVLLTDLCIWKDQFEQKSKEYVETSNTEENSVHRVKDELSRLTSSSSLPELKSIEKNSEPNHQEWKSKNCYASRDELLCRLFLANRTRRVGVVTKIFVYAANNNTESLRRIKKMHEMLKAMQSEMENVNNAHVASITHADIINNNNNSNNCSSPRKSCNVSVIPQHNLFYSVMDSTDSRFALLERSYVALSLPERLATRPYWTRHERRFICFQLLYAVAQLHEVYHTVHGDIKANNVLVQSNGWLYLTDVAPFKPAIMPIDNPAMFDYFYNTDEAHICCCAPEKFAPLSSSLLFEEYVKHMYELQEEEQHCEEEMEIWSENHHDEHVVTNDEENEKDKGKVSSKNKETSKKSENSTENENAVVTVKCDECNENVNYYYHSCEMDVFSAGCVMAYILTGSQLLRLSDVLELRDAAYSSERVRRIRNTLTEHHLTRNEIALLMEMLNPLPQHRPSASMLLSRYTNSVFPAYFDVLHTHIMAQLLLCTSADEQLLLLHSSLASMLQTCVDSACHSHKEIYSCIASTTAEVEASAVKKTTINDVNSLHNSTLVTYDIAKASSRKDNKCISHILQLLLPFLFHALRHARSAEAVYRGLLCLQSWHSRCKLSTQMNVILPELFYIINARTEYDVHARVVALRIVCTIALTICQNVERVVRQGKECLCTSTKTMAEQYEKESNCHTCNYNNSNNEINLHCTTSCEPHCDSSSVDCKTNFSTVHNEPNYDDDDDDEDEEEDWASIKVVRVSLLIFDHFYIPCVAELIDNAASELSEIILVELATQLPCLLLLARYCLVQSQNLEQMKFRIDSNNNYNNNMSDCSCKSHNYHDHSSSSISGNDDANNQCTFTANNTNNKQHNVRLDCLISVGWDMLHVLYRHPCDEVCMALLQRSLLIASFLGNERTAEDLLPLYTTLIARSTRVQEIIYFHAITLHLYLMHSHFTTMRFFVEEGLRQDNVLCQCATLRALQIIVRRDAHNPHPLFAIDDMMLLIHSILPFLLSSNDLLRIAACNVIETAVQSYSETTTTVVVKEYLSWAIRPFLIRPVPLEYLGFLSPDALRPELREVMNRNDKTFLEYDGTKNNNHDNENVFAQRQRLLTLLSRCTNTTYSVSLPQPEQFKTSAIAHEHMDWHDNKNQKEQMRYISNVKHETNEPEWNKRQRARALLVYNTVDYNNNDKSNVVDSEQVANQCDNRNTSMLQEPHRSNNLSSKAHHVQQQQHICAPNTYEQVSCAFQPSATPLHTRAAHMGAIYKLCNISPNLILSVGANHEGLMWQLKSHELHNVLRLRLPEEYDDHNNNLWRGSSKDAFTCAQTLYKCHSECTNTTYLGSASTLVALGSTSGFVYLYDVARNEYVNKICVDNGTSSDGALQTDNKFNVHVSVTSLALQSPQVLLCTTSSGQLHAMDTRIKFDNNNNNHHHHQWTSTLSTSVGVPSCCLPLYYNEHDSSTSASNSYGVVVGTTTGVVCLYDLRFQRCVKEYNLPSFEENAEWTWQNGFATELNANTIAHDSIEALTSVCSTSSIFNLENKFARPAITALVMEKLSSTRSTPLCESEEVNTGPVCLLAARDGVVYRLHLQSGNMTRKLLIRESYLYYNQYNTYTQHNTTQEHSHCAAIHSMISVNDANEQRLLTAGADKFIRSWSLSQPSQSHYLYRPPYSSPAFDSKMLIDSSNARKWNNVEKVNIQANVNNNYAVNTRSHVLQTIYEVDASKSYVINTIDKATNLSSYTQSNRSLEMPTHHTDEIMTLAIAQGTDSSEPLLLSAARDGTLVIWANQGVEYFSK